MKQFTILVILLLAVLRPQAIAQTDERNYMLTHTFLNNQGTSTLSSYQYYDDLGREDQQVLKMFTPNRKDLVTAVQYDSIGRKWRESLPTTSPQTNGGYFKDVFAYAKYITGDQSPFKETGYEDSPLNRVLSETGPGQAWHNADKRQRQEYFINDTNTAGIFYAQRYTVTANYELQSCIPSCYQTGELKIVLSIDEDNDSTLTFTDKEEHMVLTRQRNKGVSNDTYYVYNDYGLLCHVLPPILEGRTDATLLPLYAYSYKYDHRDRCTEKKLPGCAPIYMIYDRSDRVILQQDGNQRSRNRWTVLKYDKLGRILYSYEHTDPTPLESLRSAFEKLLIVEQIPTLLSSADPFHIGYTMTYGATGTDRQLLFTNYYDNYKFLDVLDINTRQALAYTYISGYAQPFGNTTGLQTGTCQSLQDGSGRNLISVSYYDEKGRPVQSHSMHIRGGYDHDYFSYNFTGKSLMHYHEHLGQNGVKIVSEKYAYTYDHAERPIETIHSLGSNTPVVLNHNWYDEQGRIQRKSLHNTTQDYTYNYNIRNWLTGISGDLFTQHLHYQDGSFAPCYNGNISAMSWKAGEETTERGYRFSYDGLNRMINALYGEGTGLNANSNCFSEQVTGYDKHGNILGLKRYGETSASNYGMIDSLAMTYDGNQLKTVNDNILISAYNNGFEFKDNANQSIEYFYDENGNLTKDLNKKITDIQYNCLNLPNHILFEDGSTVSYVYSADGAKLQTTHVTGGVSTVTEYCGNVVYENGIAKLLLTEHGYVTLNDEVYHYFIQDHQGNNRVVADQNGTVEEVNHYYPFGGIFASSSSIQPYKYNGKELDRENGLDWYDYEARQYDATLGRWNAVDPMSEKYFGVSPYVYCRNNSMNMIDPKGLTDYSVNKEGYIYKTNPIRDAIKKIFHISDKNDRLIAIDNSNRTISLPSGTIDVKSYKDGKGQKIGDFMNISNNELAVNVHDFLSENTGVEFSHVEFNNSKETDNIISTSHQAGEDALGAKITEDLTSKGLNVTQLTHSHPQGGFPSGYQPGHIQSGDKDFVKYMDSKFPENNIIYRVYDVPNKRYIYFYKKIDRYEYKKKK